MSAQPVQQQRKTENDDLNKVEVKRGIPGLTEGRIVHYQIRPGRSLAALIVNILDTSTGECTLQLFGDQNVDGFSFRQVQARYDFSALDTKQYSEGMWFYPQDK